MSVRLDPPSRIIVDNFRLSQWLDQLFSRIGNGPFKVKGYSVSSLPDAGDWGNNDFSSLIYIYDETGGAVLAFSDGTTWRRVTDRAIVS
jgi:hypothetical protein